MLLYEQIITTERLKYISKVVVYLFEKLLDPEMGEEVLIYLVIALVLFRVVQLILFRTPEKMRIWKLKRLVRKATPYTLSRLFKIVDKFSNNESYHETYNYAGLYVMYNRTKKKYFIGADDSVMDGVMTHIVGEGYRAIIEDITNADDWVIRFVPIADTRYDNLEALWISGVKAFKSNKKRRGYN